MKLKTLNDWLKENTKGMKKDFDKTKLIFSYWDISDDLRQEAIKIFKNLQTSETIYPLLLNDFPENCKGRIAKDKWNDTEFRYGTEYGMLAMLFWIFNLTEEDLMTNEEINKRENGEGGNN